MKLDAYQIHMLSETCILIPKQFGGQSNKTKYKNSSISYNKSYKYENSYIGFGFSKDLGTDVAIASLLLF